MNIIFRTMNKPIIISIAAVLLAIFYAGSGKPTLGLVVKTQTGGSVQGIISQSRDGRDFYEWLGIPYAEPPVGELRFASPVPAKPWDGIRDGSKYGPKCAQVNALGQLSIFMGSEDCLYLNVHAPKLEQAKKLPVIVWIHGGAFSMMGADDFRPEYFMDEDVILVGINYRLSSFGFISTGDEHIRGNMGLKDQAIALKWVHDNIEAFGGDPNKITVFGESSGGASVHHQTLHAKNKGLFQKAMAFSGNAAPSWATHSAIDAREKALKFASSLDCNSTDSAAVVQCLRQKSTEELLQAATYDIMNILALHPHKGGRHFSPCIEAVHDADAFLTEHPLDIVQSGRALKVPIMLGTVKDEGIFSSIELYKNEDKMASFEANWTTNVARAFGIPEKSKKAEEITTKIRDYYAPNADQLSKEEKFDAYIKMFTDAFFTFQMHHVISEQRKYSSVYPYHYTYRGGLSFAPFLGEMTDTRPAIIDAGLLLAKTVANKIFGMRLADYGVCHGDELPMVFTMMSGLFNIPKGDQHYLFSKDFTKLLVDFASTEEISLEFRGLKVHPVSKAGAVKYLEINENPQMISAPFEDRFNFLKSLGLLRADLL